MPDLRFGRPSGMVVQGTRVDPLPARPRWESDEAKRRLRCAYCQHFRRIGMRPGAHVFKNVLHLDSSA